MEFPTSLTWIGERLRSWPVRRQIALVCLLAVILAPVGPVLVFRWVPVPLTPLIAMRFLEGEGLEKQWVSLEEISPHLVRAVIASEDAKFCDHGGFDWEAVDYAVENLRSGGRRLGASTISMQTAKNVFLWPDQNFLRKGLEAYLTLWIEFAWPKDRILEVYLNVAEWGPGIYGIEAAARHYYKVPARDLSRYQSSMLAAVLPSPRRWSPVKPGPHVVSRASTIAVRMNSIALSTDGGCPD